MSARLLALLAVLLATALLAGCGGDDESAGDGATQTQAQDGQAQSDLDVEEQLGFTRNGVTAAQAKVENAIAACMKAEGFEYVPSDPVAAQAALTGKPNMSDEEFERTYGHGIATLYGKGSAQSDPNARIRAQLGDADRRAYDRTLHGGDPQQTFAYAIDNGDFSELGGCTRKATEEAFGGTRLLTTLQRELDELDEAILADGRMVRAQEAWSRCMRTATGESFEDSEAVEETIRERLEQIVGEVLAPGQVAPEGSYDKAALAELARLEVEWTNKDLACEEEHIADVEDTVRREKEARFREDNAELLRQVRPLG
jgi:hypothetical protein